ncbi:hypothetical protein DVH24_022674 [Malus domestica]|uniref:TPX2 central domain-containing protein n=1 Tax=Malus domestica TaxID=3750 RepID=A0A498KK26_MALDO|nr:hypothetical protein DVH24_022674 [Malus domestica]
MEGGETEIEGGEREMEEEMVEFAREAFEGDEIDMDYEFDALKAEEAEEWFRSAGGYKPSQNHPVPVKTSAESKDVEVTRCSNLNNCMKAKVSAPVEDNDKVSTRLEFSNHMAQDTPKTKLKSPGKSPHLSRSSTLMKPTASRLAKQNQHREFSNLSHFPTLGYIVAKKLGKLDEKSQNSPPPTMGCENSKQCSIALYKLGSAIHTFIFTCNTHLSIFRPLEK